MTPRRGGKAEDMSADQLVNWSLESGAVAHGEYYPGVAAELRMMSDGYHEDGWTDEYWGTGPGGEWTVVLHH